jgi:hypothetical protein
MASMRACATSSIVASAVVYDSTPFGAILNQKCLVVARVEEQPYIDIYILPRVEKRAFEHLRRRARESSARAALAGAVWRNRMVGQKVNV